MISVSVIICAHDPRAEHLRRSLVSLRNQLHPKSEWELLLVDNASSERLKSVWDISWHPNARHIFESEVGLGYARQCGIREAAADLLILMNDGDMLDPNYLSEALNISHIRPRVGVWSGVTRLEFEVEPPASLKEFAYILSHRESQVPLWSNVFNCFEAMPVAALCVRASVAATYCQLLGQSLIKNTFLSGDDDEISYTACSLGLGMGIFPSLKQVRLIPKEKITVDYILRRSEAKSFMRHVLMYKWQRATPTDPLSLQGLLGGFKDIFLCKGFQRRICLADLRAMRRAHQFITVNRSII